MTMNNNDPRLSNYSSLSRETNYTRTHVSRVLRGLKGYTDSFVRTISKVTGMKFLEVVAHIERNKRVNRKLREEIEEKEIERKLERLERRMEGSVK